MSLDDIILKWESEDVDLFASDYDTTKILTLSKIIVPEESRNQGIGTKVMKDIIDYANKNERTICLTPSNDFGGSKTRLIKFYKSLGFILNKGKDKDYSISELMYKLSQ